MTKKKQTKPPATLSPMGKRIGRPPLALATSTLALRVPDDVIEALDRYVVVLAKTSPGFSVTRNDAMRRLLVVGLEREGIAIGQGNG